MLGVTRNSPRWITGETDLLPRRSSIIELFPAFLAFYLGLLKRVGSPEGSRADIGFERESSAQPARSRLLNKAHPAGPFITRLVSFVKRASAKKATVNWVLGIHFVADNPPVAFPPKTIAWNPLLVHRSPTAVAVSCYRFSWKYVYNIWIVD